MSTLAFPWKNLVLKSVEFFRNQVLSLNASNLYVLRSYLRGGVSFLFLLCVLLVIILFRLFHLFYVAERTRCYLKFLSYIRSNDYFVFNAIGNMQRNGMHLA